MDNKNVDRVLVQGTATFRVDIEALVTPDQAADEEEMKEFFKDQAFKEMVAGGSSEGDADYDNEVKVTISKETADKYTNNVISRSEWNAIREESKNNSK